MLPIILSTVFMNTCLAQLQTFSVQQSITMDTRVFGFQVPGPSLPVIPLLFMFVLIPIYERVFVPLARKITGIPTGIRQLQRVGVGLVLSAISMAVAGIVETSRKSVAVEHNMVDSTEPLPMSFLWLGFQYAIFGAADMFTLVGLLEFFYAESSAGMKSLSTAISWCSLAFGYFSSTVVVEVVNKVTGGWLANNNLNRDKLNYFYWLLAGISIVNFGVYLACASWYRYKKGGEVNQIENGGGGDAKGKAQMVWIYYRKIKDKTKIKGSHVCVSFSLLHGGCNQSKIDSSDIRLFSYFVSLPSRTRVYRPPGSNRSLTQTMPDATTRLDYLLAPTTLRNEKKRKHWGNLVTIPILSAIQIYSSRL